MKRYDVAYRLGMTPWEKYGAANAESVAALLDREEADRGRPLGRALDLGCGRGQYTPELARRGWEAVGIDIVKPAVEAAREAETSGAEYVTGDVTDLPAYGLGTFDFFLDVGCFQGLEPDRRRAEGRGVTELASPGATLLMLAFGATWLRSVIEGASRAEVEEAFPGWEMLSVEPAGTASLGWPMSRTRPQWYRLRLLA
jgi:SAM-dependent methyltransferase